MESSEDLCQCPIPCDRTLFDPTITYGSNSNFDMDKMLRGQSTGLENRYIKARETIQRVNRDIVNDDQTIFHRFYRSVEKLDKTLNRIPVAITKALNIFEEAMYKLGKRIEFHDNRGLGGKFPPRS